MKIPKAKKLPSGSWHIQLRLGGESIPITAPTERACIQQAQLVKAKYLAGKKEDLRTERRQTLGKLLQDYIENKRPVLSPSTVRGYEAILRTRFLAYTDRDPANIRWQAMINEESRRCAPKTLKNAWALVAAALAYSGRPVPAVTLPQLINEEHPFLEAEQIPVFLDAIRGNRFELAALFGLHGLRRSEMFALEWPQIDLEARTVTIRGAVVHDASGKLVRKKTNKNASSRRTIPIMIPRLEELLQQVPPEERKGPLLTCHPNSVYKAVNTVCDRAGLPRIGVHGLRHSLASLAHSLGVPEQETMYLGGWKDPQTMRKIYTHLDAASKLKATNAITAFYTSGA